MLPAAQIIWQNNSSGFAFSNQNHHGVTPGGRMLIARGRLWLRGRHSLTVSYDLKTGQLEMGGDLRKYQGGGFFNGLHYSASLAGKEIGLLDNRFLLYGGFPLYCADQNELWGNNGALNERRGYQFAFLEIDADGKALFPAHCTRAMQRADAGMGREGDAVRHGRREET